MLTDETLDGLRRVADEEDLGPPAEPYQAEPMAGGGAWVVRDVHADEVVAYFGEGHPNPSRAAHCEAHALSYDELVVVLRKIIPEGRLPDELCDLADAILTADEGGDAGVVVDLDQVRQSSALWSDDEAA